MVVLTAQPYLKKDFPFATFIQDDALSALGERNYNDILGV